MKKIISIVTLLILPLQAGSIRSAEILQNEMNVVRVSNKEPLTIVFPFPLEQRSISGADITGDPAAGGGESFFLTYEVGREIIDMRAQKLNSVTTINILTAENDVYVLKLIATQEENDSVVKFTKRKEIPKAASSSYRPKKLSDYIDRTFNYPLLKKADSPLIENSQEVGRNEVHSFPNGSKMIVETFVKWEDPHPNILTVNGYFTAGQKDIFYDRSSVYMMIGGKKFTPSIIQASGVMKSTRKVGGTFQMVFTKKDYPELLNIDLEANKITYGMTFEEPSYKTDHPDYYVPESVYTPSLLPQK